MRWGFQALRRVATSAILAAIAARPELGTVVLVSRWAFYAMGERFRHEAGPPVFILDGESGGASLAENGRVFARGLARTVAALTALGRRVVVVTPGAGERVRPAAGDGARALARPRGRLRAGTRRLRGAAGGRERGCSAPRRAGGATMLDLGDALCPGDRCPVARDGLPLYRDSNHLTATYAPSSPRSSHPR